VLPSLRQPLPHVAVVIDISGSMNTDDLTAALADRPAGCRAAWQAVRPPATGARPRQRSTGLFVANRLALGRPPPPAGRTTRYGTLPMRAAPSVQLEPLTSGGR
jgi:hypothetical protein